MRKLIMSLVVVALTIVPLVSATMAVFSESEELAGNTISTATVNIDLRAFSSGEIAKPIDVEGMVPGEWTDWARAEIYNQADSTDVELYFYVKDVSGDACAKTNLQMTTGYAGSDSDERARDVYNGALNGVKGAGNRIEVTGNPPFDVLQPNWTQVVQQRAQLDSSAGNALQGTSCVWTEVFVAETPQP